MKVQKINNALFVQGKSNYVIVKNAHHKYFCLELIKTNNDKWITVKPHGEEEKGRHLKLEGDETPKEAMKRQWGVDVDKKKQLQPEKRSEKSVTTEKSESRKKLEQEKEDIDKRIRLINDSLDAINKESDKEKKKILENEFGKLSFENQKEYYSRMAELTKRFADNKERQQLLEEKRELNKKYFDVGLKINKIIAEETYYPNEISGVKKSRNMTFDDADGGRVNPYYKNGGKSNYEENCQSCVVAFEARLRGYDVEASKVTKLTDTLSWGVKNAWINPETGDVPNDIVPQDFDRFKGKPYNPKKYIDFLNAEIEEGNRYNMSFTWKSSRSRKGHVVSIFKDKEGIKIYDPQSGKIEKDLTTYFKEVKFISNSLGIKSNEIPRLYRVDNLSFNPEFFGVMVEANNDKQ